MKIRGEELENSSFIGYTWKYCSIGGSNKRCEITRSRKIHCVRRLNYGFTFKDIRRNFCKKAKEKMQLKYHGDYPKQIDSHFEFFDDDIYKEVAKEFEPYFLF